MSIFPLHQWLCCILCRYSLWSLCFSNFAVNIATTQYPYVTCAYLSFLQVRIKVFLYAMQDVWLLFLAVKINFLLIRLTKQIALSYFRCWFPILFADTGESWSTDSPAKRKTIGNTIQILHLIRKHKISFLPMKTLHAIAHYTQLLYLLPGRHSLFESLSRTLNKEQPYFKEGLPCFSFWWVV